MRKNSGNKNLSHFIKPKAKPKHCFNKITGVLYVDNNKRLTKRQYLFGLSLVYIILQISHKSMSNIISNPKKVRLKN